MNQLTHKPVVFAIHSNPQTPNQRRMKHQKQNYSPLRTLIPSLHSIVLFFSYGFSDDCFVFHFVTNNDSINTTKGLILLAQSNSAIKTMNQQSDKRTTNVLLKAKIPSIYYSNRMEKCNNKRSSAISVHMSLGRPLCIGKYLYRTQQETKESHLVAFS